MRAELWVSLYKMGTNESYILIIQLSRCSIKCYIAHNNTIVNVI